MRVITRDWISALYATAMEQDFMNSDLYRTDPEYRALRDALGRLRRLRWSDEDEDGLVALEARVFRLLATLRRLNDDIDASGYRRWWQQ